MGLQISIDMGLCVLYHVMCSDHIGMISSAVPKLPHLAHPQHAHVGMSHRTIFAYGHMNPKLDFELIPSNANFAVFSIICEYKSCY